MGDEKQAPLTDKEVKGSAKKLGELANEFLDKNEEAAFDKWHVELRQVAKHGVLSTKQVFKQIEKDSGDWTAIAAPKVKARDTELSAEITIQPSRLTRMLGTKDYIGGMVDKEEVLSAAKTRKGKNLAEITIQTNLSSNPFDLPQRRYNPFELFPTKPSALDFAPKTQKLDWTKLADIPVKK